MTHPALKDRASLLALLDAWAARGWLRSLDAAFASFLAREVAEAPALLLLAAALASHQLGRGHACLDLADTLGDPGFALSLPPEGEGADADADAERPVLPADLLEGLSLEAWRAALALPSLVGQGEGDTPLLCLGQRVYLRRYWQYEGAVASGIGCRLDPAREGPVGLPADRLAAALTALFPQVAGVTGPDWQKLACALAARSAFAIVTGGPGTGKTTTVVRLLAVLQALALGAGEGEPPLRIRLAAPTGKAAARLNESIAGAVASLDLAALADGDAVRKAIPTEVTTLHRLLGSRPGSRHFRHHAGNPLGVDVLVVDEASMVDLEMMAAVLDALPAGARLVLLGDKDQLASVEAGAVLGELCRRAREGHYSPATADWLAAVSGARVPTELVDPAGQPLDQAVAMLRHSHRFGAASGIGQLAAAVNAGAAEKAAALFDAGLPDLARLSPGAGEAAFRRLVVEGDPAHGRAGYRTYLETLQATRPADDAGQAAFDDWARRVLKAHGSFQLLCALRRGRWGIEGLNPRIAGWLREAGLIPAAEGWYLGRPVLVTRNDYGLGLMNGDIGITLALPGPRGAEVLRVAFPAGDGQNGIRWVLPSRLQAVDTVYALTVHKSQGSEFVHAALALPDTLSPILTRELVYTGITRARSGFTLVDQAASGVLERAIGRQVLRVSGLMERLDRHTGEQA
ncbi:exodeoxyribonuclease V subunit alpha [Zoogloea dura]|uniref:RecBCD enzyme subunit RecD n=1 Tax=Zoogloea dura TaxID=2728840 RepID=A0A848G6X9_9RHOO|nr:exodeoxyribonuclease V subunit alpha [Zoogloea dura]NML26666.1 exodeoxyribonuclease V subunit alpha [Zoogloea dura]